MGQILCKYVCAADKYSEFAFRLYAYKLELKRIRLFFDSNSYEHKVEVIQFIFYIEGMSILSFCATRIRVLLFSIVKSVVEFLRSFLIKTLKNI